MSRLNRQAALAKLHELRPDIRSDNDLDNELQAEYLNAFVFAGDTVLAAFGGYISAPTYEHFAEVAAAMREELWGLKRKVAREFVEVIRQFPEPRKGT